MTVTIWYLIVGAVFIVMALGSSLLKRLPLSTSMIYLLIGLGIGPLGLGIISLDPIADATLIEHLTEITVIVSLFTAGLKLRAGLSDPLWRVPLRLASVAMLITVGLIALAAVFGLGLSLGAAVLLGAILAPTDPVLASDVQVDQPSDGDRVRFGLTGEAGLNDGTAFPMVMLGLGLLGLYELGGLGWRWLAVDVLWAIGGGLAIGWLLGHGIGWLVIHLRRVHQSALGLDDFLALGLIALSYGVAHLLYAYGFLAVFAAGLALRTIERRSNAEKPAEEALRVNAKIGEEEQAATDTREASTYMAQAVLGFNEQLERICEVAIVLLVGVLLPAIWPDVPAAALWFIPLLFLVLRPIAVWISLIGRPLPRIQRFLISWFGIRGIGSIYYLMYAITHGLAPELARPLAGIVLVTIAASIIVHGVSVTPLMQRYSSGELGAAGPNHARRPT
jgi:sodium/hydrogen antiporter